MDSLIFRDFYQNSSTTFPLVYCDRSQPAFDDYPMNYYYNEEGESVGEGVKSTLTNEQIIRLCLRMIVSKSQGDRRVKVIFVGTHRDEEHKCTETREEKESQVKGYGEISWFERECYL